MIPQSHEGKSQKEEERKSHLNDQVVREQSNGINVCSFPQDVKKVGWDSSCKESEGNSLRCISGNDGNNGCAIGRASPRDESGCTNIVAKEKKRPFLHEVCKNYVMLTFHRRCYIVLSVIIGFLIVTLMSISFYMNIFSEVENRPQNLGAIFRKINEEKFTKMNVAKASDVVIHTSDSIGNEVEHFFNFYKKEKTATLLFYLDKEQDKTILQYDTLKDIFFLVQFFKQMNTGNKKNWSEMCKSFDVPMMESKCFVLGLFTISELQDIDYDTTPNWKEYFDDLLEKDERSLSRFFYNALIFLPHFLYQPHKFDIQRTKIKDIISDMSKNVEALLFVFNFDEGIDDSSLNEWYRLLNMHVKLINERKKEFLTIQNLDGSTYVHEINEDRNWSMAVVNEKVLEDNEQSSINVGFKSNYVFAILSFLFLIIYVCSIPSDTLKNNGQNEGTRARTGRMFCLILSVYILTFFSFFSTFFIYLVFQINVLRIYLLNFFPLFFLSFLFCCVNIFFRNKCVVGPSKMIMRRMRSAKNSKIESVDMTKYYLRASYKSLYFVCKITLIILAVYLVGFACTYRIVNVFSVNSVFAVVCLFLYYAVFFNNMFGFLFYRDRYLLLSPPDSLPRSKSVGTSSGDQPNQPNLSDQHVIAFSEVAPSSELLQNNCTSNGNLSREGNNTSLNVRCSCESAGGKKHHIKSCISPNGREDRKKASSRKGPKKGFLFLVVLLSLLLLGLFLSFLINRQRIHLDVYHYMTKESPLRRFIQNFENRAGFVIEPAYLVLPPSEDFDYADEENANMIIKLVNEMKEQGFIHEPIVSWVHAFELLKNDCRNVDSFSNQFDLHRYRKLCNDITPMRENKELHLNKLKEIFFKDEEKTCDSFYQIVYEWMNHKEDGAYDNQFFTIRTLYGGGIDQVLPQYYNIRPHSFYGDFVKMDSPHKISSSRIGFVLHNHASNEAKNMENMNRIENIIKRSNLKNVYFYSESYVLYKQATGFMLECKVVLIFYFFIYLFSLYLFNTMGVVMIFQFWFCYNLSVLYFMHSFGVNTDAITIILFKMGAVISLSHYLYQTLFFNSIMLDRNNYSNSMRQSYPYLIFLVLYLISFTLEDYASNVLRLLILNHVVWFFLYSITIFYVHKMYVNRA